MGTVHGRSLYISRGKRNEIPILLSWFSSYVAGIYEGGDLREKLQAINHFIYKTKAETEYLMLVIYISSVGDNLPNNLNILSLNELAMFCRKL